jgi:Uma2 family endonuclease
VPDGPWTERHLHALAPGHRYEIVDGCLHATPPPCAGHQRLVEAVLAALAGTAPPSWRPVGGVGLHLGESYLTADLAVLRPGAPADAVWTDPRDVALVVEVESAHSRRVDRCLKAALYAEADIEAYWRVERNGNGPVAHLYNVPSGGHYHQHRAVHPGQVVTAELPYAVQVAPATWH